MLQKKGRTRKAAVDERKIWEQLNGLKRGNILALVESRKNIFVLGFPDDETCRRRS